MEENTKQPDNNNNSGADASYKEQADINNIAKISIFQIYTKLLPLYDNDLGKAEEHFDSLLKEVEEDVWNKMQAGSL